MLEVNEFVKWCDVNYLNLNVKKTMEMFVDFRKDTNEYETLSIKNEDVKVVRSYKYLGVYIDDQLNFSENAQYLFKKGIQRIHFLRLLNNTRQVTRATHVRNRICPRVKFIIKIIIILLIIFLGFIKSKSC